MNTRNAFHGLDENLKALAPPKLSFKTTKTSLLEEDFGPGTRPPPPEASYDRQVLTEEDTTVLGLMNENCSKGYDNMVKEISQAMKAADTSVSSNNVLVTPYRYQTITFENLGYSGANVDVRPYGIAKYHFVAEYDNELSLYEGDMVYLVRYVDNEWLEAELDSNRRSDFTAL